MILIHPPVAKAGEPPAGLAKLAGALRAHSVQCDIIDANLEGLLYLMENQADATDTWTTRARANLSGNLAAIRNRKTYHINRYIQVATELNRVLAMAGRPSGVHITLADFRDEELSPVRSADLIRAAEEPERNPFYPYFSKRFSEETLNGDVGFSLNYLSQAITTFAMIGWIRKKNPGVKIVLGGGLVTSWMRSPRWTNPFTGLVHTMVPGSGEQQLLTMAGIEETDLCGRHYTFDYDLFPRDRYLSPGFILPYSASRGCYWNSCLFCPEKAEGNEYTPVPAKTAINEIKILAHKYRPGLIHLLDNAVSPKLLRAIGENPLPAPWYGFTRVTRDLEDLAFCRSLRESGCVMLKLGLESGDQGVLEALHKGITPDQASRALKNLREAGIAVYCYFLFGTTAETRREAESTLEFVARHKDCIGFLNLAIFNLPAYGPGVEALEVDQFYEGDLSLYNSFEHPEGWNRNLVRHFLEKEFKKHPAVAEILRRNPPFFTSNHAAFFV
ncbi:MAG: radical SAM protein [bacterium]|nr:radical SAM protein [bacterium]